MRPASEYTRKAEELMDNLYDGPTSEYAVKMEQARVNATLAQAAAICELIDVLRPQVERERAK